MPCKCFIQQEQSPLCPMSKKWQLTKRFFTHKQNHHLLTCQENIQIDGKIMCETFSVRQNILLPPYLILSLSAKPAILDRQLLFTLGRTCLVMLAGRNSQSMFASVCLGKRRMPRKFGAQVKQFPRCLGTPWIIHSFGSKLSETATCFPPVGDLTEPGVLLETRVQEKLGGKWHTYDKTGFLGENVITLILRWKVNGPYDSFLVNF